MSKRSRCDAGLRVVDEDYSIVSIPDFFFYGATTHSKRIYDHTPSGIPYSVEPLWTSDRPGADTST